MPRKYKLVMAFLAVTAIFLIGNGTAGAWQLENRPAAEWIRTLERPERIAGLKIDEILAKLNLKPGMVVADIGSGSGVFSRPMAKAVAPDGKVISVDIDSALLSYVSERAAKEHITNIETHLAVPDDAKLSGPIVDLAFFHDVLHHIEHRELYLKNLAKYIKPGGRVAMIENEASNANPMQQHKPEMLMKKEDVQKWMATAGFRPVETIDLFAGKKWFIIFGR
jgi:arsenite methyltransferase